MGARLDKPRRFGPVVTALREHLRELGGQDIRVSKPGKHFRVEWVSVDGVPRVLASVPCTPKDDTMTIRRVITRADRLLERGY